MIPIVVEDERTAQANIESVNAALRPHFPEWSRRLNAMVSSREPVRVRLRLLRDLADEITEYARDYSPCRKGCNHCCHMATMVSEPEAAMIGALIRKSPKKPKQWADFRDKDAIAATFLGTRKACTFLDNGVCSIYEHRPLACRMHVSMGASSSACEMDQLRQLPLLNLSQLDKAYAMISATLHMADIRAYFPNGLRTGR